MSYSEGETFQENPGRDRRWARVYKALQDVLYHERDQSVGAHVRAAFDELNHAEKLSYGDVHALSCCSEDREKDSQNWCKTCAYSRQKARVMASVLVKAQS